jgi:hypothetical protein
VGFWTGVWPSFAAFSAGVFIVFRILGIIMTERSVGHCVLGGTHRSGLFHLFSSSFIRKTTAFLDQHIAIYPTSLFCLSVVNPNSVIHSVLP